MNKVIKTTVAIVIVLAIAIAGYYGVFLPNYYDIRIGIGKPAETTLQYMEDFTISYSHISETHIPLIEELTNTKNEFRSNFYKEHKDDIYTIEIDITVKDGKTIVRYAGRITDSKTDKTEPFEKIFVHNFILTKDIQQSI